MSGMKRKRLVASAAALVTGMTMFSPLWAQSSEVQRSSERASEIIENQRDQTGRSEAEKWGLSDREWQRYERLMESKRGIWSPGLDPLTALGVEARSDAERRRYAELLVQQERARVQRELEFQRAYDAAWDRLYPDANRVDPFTVETSQTAESVFQGGGQSVFGQAGQASATTSRLNVVVAIDDCNQCDSTVQRLMDRGALMDIWVVDSDGDNRRIQDWARSLEMPADRVQRGEITLNHGGQLSAPMESLPQVIPRG
ncbi:TIGR03759 family integrating conjugative element protein [Halomonas sp. THAF12]|uniref:TIGR03759 family integrating conjugative element protein n=1 Tax=Halomonas sp. B23F22_10 TaxID=3459515 RepID=UPI00373FB7E9